MSIFYEKELDCGCRIKYYRGGKCILTKHIDCIIHDQGLFFVCGVCRKEFNKKQLKKHQWIHAV